MTDQDHWDFSGYIAHLETLLPGYEVSPGLFGRHRDRRGHVTEGAADAYGTADAANILYTIGRLPGEPAVRSQMVEGIRSFQDESGVFVDPTHSDIHTTAHCVAALELFDARPRHRLSFLDRLRDEPGALERFLDELDWGNAPWPASHDGAGVAAAFRITGEADAAWFDRYFAWLDENADPATGLWRRGFLHEMRELPGRFGDLAGTFHYHFNYLDARRPFPYAERVIDSCLDIAEQSPIDLAVHTVEFKDVDWVFCLNRATRQAPHRFDESRAALVAYAARLHERLTNADYLASEAFDDLHTIFGGLSAVAELQSAIPGLVHADRALRPVLDRRPFI